MVKFISASSTHPLRLKVLRPGLPPQHAILDNDDADGTFHLGYFHQGELVCIGSFMPSNWQGEPAYQLRGMATHPDFMRRGFAKKLIETGEKIIKSLEINILWFNAREGAIPFYQKLEFKVQSDAFLIKDVGTHFLMNKFLN